MLIEKIVDVNVICDYCHKEPAKFYIGKNKRPCCQDKPGKCSAVITKNLENGRKTKKEKYGSETYNNSAKRAETNLRLYGNVCSLHGKEQEEMTRQTWLKNYGYENRLDSPVVQKQMSNIIFDRYGVKNPFRFHQ